MKEYMDMWKRFADFNGCTSRRGYWMAILFNFIISTVIAGIAGMLEMGSISSLYTLAVTIPALAILVRRLRDAGYHWANIFWSFLPFVGTIILLVRLCKPTAQVVEA